MNGATPPDPNRVGVAVPPLDIAPLGDTAVVVRVGTRIDEVTRRWVLSVLGALESAGLPGSAEVVPGFTTVTVHYDPTRLGWERGTSPAPYDVMHRHVVAALNDLASVDLTDGTTVELPVCYGGEFGPDLDHVAAHAGLSAQEVIARHAAGDYRVHLVGFLPGFPYLGGLDSRLATPRRDTPRTVVPAGSVGIGGMQTGVYPLESPGGWQLIGRSPLILFDPFRVPPTLLAPGDRVRFRAIERAEYDLLRGAPR